MGLLSFFSDKPTNNGRTTAKKFRLKNLTIVIEVENVDSTGQQVYLETFGLPKPLTNGVVSTEIMMSSTAEFFEDIENMISLMKKAPELNNRVYVETLEASCRSHIKKFGRIVDSDLKSLIYTVMYVIDAIVVAEHGRHIAIDMRRDFSRSLFQTVSFDYKKYLWTWQPDVLSFTGGGQFVKAIEDPNHPYYKMPV